jgi:hypothetical protein
MVMFDNAAAARLPTTPLEQACSTIKTVLLLLPVILQAPFRELTLPLLTEGKAVQQKSVVYDKLATTTSTPKSA